MFFVCGNENSGLIFLWRIAWAAKVKVKLNLKVKV
jgi:hypothetical protein